MCRTTSSDAVDPLNLLWVMPAKGGHMSQTFRHDLIVSEYLSPIDFSLMAFFVLAYLVIPKIVEKRAKSDAQQEYLLMGRGLTLPLFVATLVSTWYGGIFGVTQIAFENGVYSFFTQGLFWYVAYFIFAVALAKKIRQQKVLSLPEIIGRKFGPKARKLSGVILFLHALPVTYGVSVGIFLQIALGLDFVWALMLGVLIVAIYTSLGGLRGVVATDCLQFILMFVAVGMVTIALITQFGGISFLKDNLPMHYFSWRAENQFMSALIWLFISCTSTLIHPVFYQRCLAAKTDNVAIFGIFVAMFFWLIFDICTTLGGMYARVLLPEADSAKAYLLLGIQLLPEGLRGLFISGILATILSTLDSFMFVSGISISYDVFGKSRIFRVHAHKIAVLFCGLCVIALALVFGTNFEQAWLFREGSFSTALLTPVLASVLCKRRFNETIFIFSAASALLAFAVTTYWKEKAIITFEPFYAANAIALLMFFATSYIYAHREAKLAGFADG